MLNPLLSYTWSNCSLISSIDLLDNIDVDSENHRHIDSTNNIQIIYSLDKLTKELQGVPPNKSVRQR